MIFDINNLVVADFSRDKTDYDVLREQQKFTWSDEDDTDNSWGKQLAKKHYDKPFKEYCVSDCILKPAF